MIAQTLQKQAVLDQFAAVKIELERMGGTERRGAGLPEHFEASDVQAALHRLGEAEKELFAGSGGQPGFEVPVAGRRGVEPLSIDDTVFLSRDPAVSILQSALEEYLETVKPEAIAPPMRRGFSEVSPVTTRRLLNSFSETDPRWVACKVAEGIRLLTKAHPFPEKPSTPVRMANRARIVLVGDWGSGLERAQSVAAQMRREIELGQAAGLDQHVLHLGDVYYSGWAWEYSKRFLPYWPVRPEEADSIASWSLNGNHDMYSGGWGYFDTLLGDPRFKRHQGSSFFRLFNDHWQALGLDTAYKDNALAGPQDGWVRDCIHQSAAKTILFSHHQLFTVFESDHLSLGQELRQIIRDQGVRAWFWGHEHRCLIYDTPTEGVAFPRCVGHGGVPVYMLHDESTPPAPPLKFEYRKYLPGLGGIEHWAFFGFAVLDFDGPIIHARYVYEDGFEYREEIQ